MGCLRAFRALKEKHIAPRAMLIGGIAEKAHISPKVKALIPPLIGDDYVLLAVPSYGPPADRHLVRSRLSIFTGEAHELVPDMLPPIAANPREDTQSTVLLYSGSVQFHLEKMILIGLRQLHYLVVQTQQVFYILLILLYFWLLH